MTSDPKLHPGTDVLETYALGHLTGDELELLEEHLFVCEICQNELAQVDSYILTLKDACREVRPEVQPAEVRLAVVAPRREGFFQSLFAVPRPVLIGAMAAFFIAIVIPISYVGRGAQSPMAVELATSRGAGPGGVAIAESGHPLALNLNASDLQQPARAEIVNSSGKRVWIGPVDKAEGRISLSVRDSLAAGTYWVRLYGADGESLREFGLELK